MVYFRIISLLCFLLYLDSLYHIKQVMMLFCWTAAARRSTAFCALAATNHYMSNEYPEIDLDAAKTAAPAASIGQQMGWFFSAIAIVASQTQCFPLEPTGLWCASPPTFTWPHALEQPYQGIWLNFEGKMYSHQQNRKCFQVLHGILKRRIFCHESGNKELTWNRPSKNNDELLK